MFSRIRSWFAPAPAPKRQARGNYAGAQLTRFAQWAQSLESADKEIKRDIKKLREHSRDLTKNNAFMRRYSDLVATHVAGPDGVKFESSILGNLDKPKTAWNQTIEQEWAAWGRSCTVDGRLSWVQLQQLAVTTAAVDGEFLALMIRGARNRWGFALQVVDADQLDHTMNQPLAGGHQVVMGVEQDQTGRPVAYWIWTTHPSDSQRREHRRVPAADVIHLYRTDRARQTRGVPWASPVMLQVNMLGRYWTSEVAAANAEADRLGFLIGKEIGDGEVANPAEMGLEIQSDHATLIPLPAGVDVNIPMNQHPAGAFGDFTRAMLKGISAGLGVAYHSLSCDVADANYSSARVALLEERDNWRRLQRWFVDGFCDPVFRSWLQMSLVSGAVPIQIDYERLACPTWWPRTWAWVDPEKDIKASVLAIRSGLSTHQEELGALGRDWRETVLKLKEFKDFTGEKGVVIDYGDPAPSQQKEAPSEHA